MSSQPGVSKKNAILTACAVAVWVIILAAIKHYLEHGLGMSGCWTFTAIILFFALMPGDLNTRIKHTMGGAIFGVLSAIFIYVVAAQTASLHHVWGSMIPTAIAIFVIIVGHNILPTFLNDTAFGYMILSTMKGQEALMSHLPSHFFFLIVGGLIAIYGTIWVKTTAATFLEKRDAARANQNNRKAG